MAITLVRQSHLQLSGQRHFHSSALEGKELLSPLHFFTSPCFPAKEAMAVSPPPSDSTHNKAKDKSSRLSLQKQKQKQKQKLKQSPANAKRTKSPGVRVIGNRIYDSENGKTCHQCRQKTMDFCASCKNEKSQNRPCTFKFCHKCLFNRYGEKAEEVETLADWKCPKCRGICNCSFCMKKRGQQPTGILAHTAKATGFSSVSELLHFKDHDAIEKITKELRASLNKANASNRGVGTTSKRKSGKETDIVEEKESNSQSKHLPEKDDAELSVTRSGRKKPKLHRINCNSLESSCNDDGLNKKNLKTWVSHKVSANTSKNEENTDGVDSVFPTCGNAGGHDIENINDAEVKASRKSKFGKLKKHIMLSHDLNADNDIVLPQGNNLLDIAGIQLPPHDVGPALQFLEFCYAFGEFLDIKKGQPESVLRELTCRRLGREGKYSSIIEFHIKLLSLIQKNIGDESLLLYSTNGSSAWLEALEKCITETQYAPKELHMDLINRGPEGYDELDSSKKLRLLTFLCDETLGTENLRNCIEEENPKYLQRKKEAKESVLAAKEKEKQLKQKMKDELAKAILASRNGAPLSIGEHEGLISKIRTESKKAHAEMLHAMDMVPKRKQRADAVRTEPVLLDENGRVYWRLRGNSSNSNVIVQDIGNRDLVGVHDSWFTFDDEQRKVIEKYISSLSTFRTFY